MPMLVDSFEIPLLSWAVPPPVHLSLPVHSHTQPEEATWYVPHSVWKSLQWQFLKENGVPHLSIKLPQATFCQFFHRYVQSSSCPFSGGISLCFYTASSQQLFVHYCLAIANSSLVPFQPLITNWSKGTIPTAWEQQPQASWMVLCQDLVFTLLTFYLLKACLRSF